GAVSMLLGALMLFKQPTLGGLSVSMGMVLTTIIGLIAVVAALALVVLRAQLRRVVTGIESLRDKRGLAKTALAPKGKVLVEGELWDAESVSGDIPAGAEVSVDSIDGFKIRVKKGT
ncbi:MAG: NfeD family protein, partial [Elusimicrobiales bacterium]